jgi:hypothetical protein
MKGVLAFASMLTLTSLGAGCHSGGSRSSIVGAWRSSIQFHSGAFAAIHDLQFMYVFHADGTLTESSNYDAAPPVPPAYGVWRTVGWKEIEARYEFFATTPSGPDAFKSGAGWMPSGRGVLTERIKLSDDGDAFSSTITYEALDQGGKAVEGGGTGQSRGVRMRP